ncbi:MAG TPA: hypothetical protein VNL39_14290, partial [Xanthobacteraceae bacterium]|nr:hypothetical protein [Xanthobacteraceae bacterium]
LRAFVIIDLSCCLSSSVCLPWLAAVKSASTPQPAPAESLLFPARVATAMGKKYLKRSRKVKIKLR